MKIVQCALTAVLCAALLTGCGARIGVAADRSAGIALVGDGCGERDLPGNHSGGEAVEVSDEGEILVTEEIADRFTLNEGKTETVRVLEA